MPYDKTAIKAQIKQQIMERALAKYQPDQPKYSVGGFFANVKTDIGEIVNGVGTLLGLGGKAIMHPVETVEFLKSPQFPQAMKAIGSSMVSEYKEYKSPLKKLYEDPLQVVTDALTIATLGGAALTKVGISGDVAKALSTAGITAKETESLAKAGELGKIAQAGAKLSYLGKPLEVSADLAKFGISKIPGGKEFLTAMEQRSKTIGVVSGAAQSHIMERNKSLKEIDDVLKTLTPEEKNILIPYSEGLVDVAKPSVNFSKAVDLVGKLSEQRKGVIEQAGKLKPTLIEAREWQPIMKATGMDNIDEIKATFGLTKDPIYVQHLFEDNPKKFTDFFANTAPVKNWKPGFLKKFFGVEGYSIDPEYVLKWETAQTLKFKNNIDLLNRVKSLDFVEPLDNIKNLKSGYKVFAPDGYIRFYRGTLDLVNEFTKTLRGGKGAKIAEDIWENLKEAVDSSLIEKTYTGVTSKVKLYQVPEATANILQGYAKTTSPWIKLFLDKPTDAFRFLALALTPRWLVNNIIGNTIMSIVAGDPFSPAGYLTAKKAQELGLVPDEVFSGFYRTEQLMSGKLGKAAETKVGQLMSNAGKKISETPILKQIGKIGDISYKINAVTDDFFRASHYVNVATREARKKMVLETGQKLTNTIKLLEYAQKDPEIIAKAINSIETFFYGASKLSPFERNVVRRFLPFYSWYKFIGTYAVNIPLKYPGRFNLIQNIAKTFYSLTNQDSLPEYLRGSVPIGETKNGDIYYLRTSGMNPFGLLEDLATIGAEQTALYSLTPAIKTLVERLTARESFTGKTYTAKGITEQYNGRLYKVNSETGKVEEVTGKTKPALLEHLLRNFVPQYTLLEQAILGGKQAYTSAGLPSILSGQAIVTSPITGKPKTNSGAVQKLKLKALGLLGFPVTLRTEEQMQSEADSLQRATSELFYNQNPTMSPMYKANIKEELRKQILQNVETKGILEGIW